MMSWFVLWRACWGDEGEETVKDDGGWGSEQIRRWRTRDGVTRYEVQMSLLRAGDG